ncbi:MAG: hypothetical protein M1812_000388 [Candelaria pacifica]|nr:MAG: hypothetical protein M1812_000388 [Candelaria pacifica]
MARRRTKKRTHVGANSARPKGSTNNASMSREPKSMVVRVGAGEVGPSITQLVKDVRTMLEPGTASRLKERRSNRLRDYTTMAGPLGVSHLLLFSRSSSGNTNLRLALTPRGPTLHFNVEKYSLCKDVKKAMKHPKGGGKEFLTAPLLVMNNFTTQPSPEAKHPQPAIPKHLESLTTTIFQSLFPPISPQTTPLTSINRVLLLNREPSSSTVNSSYTLNLRHYMITTRRTGLSRGIRRLNAAERLLNSREKKRKGLPNLGKLEDVADYLLDPAAAGGYTSASESEVETDAEVEVLEARTKKVLSKKELQRAQDGEGKSATGNSGSGVEKRAVKLVELGPRMKLRMTKVEEGVCGGKIMWHEYLNKTKEQIIEMDEIWEARRKEKEARKTMQRENVERKRKERGAGSKRDAEDAVEEDMDDEEWDSEGLEGDDDGMQLEEEEREDEDFSVEAV